MELRPYLFFDGRCDEALEFYQGAVGAEVVSLRRFRDAPPHGSPDAKPHGAADKVMHGEVHVGGATVFVSDGHADGRPTFHGFALCLTTKTSAETRKAFDALVVGGHVQSPLAETFFSPLFGMLVDRFGVSWIVYAAK